MVQNLMRKIEDTGHVKLQTEQIASIRAQGARGRHSEILKFSKRQIVMQFWKAEQLGLSVPFKVFIYLVLSQSYRYLNLRRLNKIFQNVTPSFLVAENADK